MHSVSSCSEKSFLIFVNFLWSRNGTFYGYELVPSQRCGCMLDSSMILLTVSGMVTALYDLAISYFPRLLKYTI